MSTDTSPLMFRPEAVEHREQNYSGAILLTTPTSSWIITFILGTLIAFLILFLSLTSYARKETVKGILQNSEETTRITAQRSGVVSELFVNEGQFIKKGQEIAQVVLLSNSPDMGVHNNLQDLLLGQKIAMQETANAKIEGQKIQIQILSQKENTLIAEKKNLLNQISVQLERIELQKENISRVNNLKQKGYLSENALNEEHSILLVIEQELDDFQIRKNALISEAQFTKLNLKKAENEIANIMAELNSNLTSLEQSRVEAKGSYEYVINSPVNGTVGTILIDEGNAIENTATLLTVNPEQSELSAILFIPSRSAGHIKVGQVIKLKYDAFPFQRYGTGEGRIRIVGKELLFPSEIKNTAITISEPVYKLQVELNDVSINAYGKSLALRSGMSLDAEIIIERRSLLKWLFDPIYAMGR